MTPLIGRTARRYADAAASAPRSPLLPKLLVIAMLAFAVTACGVKNDLVKPNGQAPTKDEHDPSKPPYPLGR
jgi:predicted small lipoprotein YifL